jgi:hypothetical protein
MHASTLILPDRPGRDRRDPCSVPAHEAAERLRFEYAARLRVEINELRRELRDAD